MNAIVAGDNAGAGAEEVVLVRETAERDLSRNSTIDCKTSAQNRTTSI